MRYREVVHEQNMLLAKKHSSSGFLSLISQILWDKFWCVKNWGFLKIQLSMDFTAHLIVEFVVEPYLHMENCWIIDELYFGYDFCLFPFGFWWGKDDELCRKNFDEKRIFFTKEQRHINREFSFWLFTTWNIMLNNNLHYIITFETNITKMKAACD